MPANTAPQSSPHRYRMNTHPRGTHRTIVRLVPPGSRVLDLGCAHGYLGRVLSDHGCMVWGLDIDQEAVRAAMPFYVDARVVDLDADWEFPWPDCAFDVVLAADVLEHLRDPARALHLALGHLRPGGRVIVSLPNVAHFSVRIPLLFGQFRYRKTGILDQTHLRFFTFGTALEFASNVGLHVEAVLAGSNRFGFLLNRFGLLGRPLRGLLAYNIILVCRPQAAAGGGTAARAS